MKGTGILNLSLRCKRMAPLAAVALAASLMLPGTSLAATPHPVKWLVNIGGQSPDKARQTNFFFNRDITVDVGDTVQWTQAANEIHTVTLNGNGPPTEVPSGSDFDGSVSASSPIQTPFDTPGQTFSLRFTKAGNYTYVCLIHSTMHGVIHVQDQGAAYPKTQAQYDAQSQILRASYGAQAAALQAKGLIDAVTQGPTRSTVGIGQLFAPDRGSLAVLRFLPSQNVIHAGQTVTWTNMDPETPHTITFGTEPANPLPPSSNVVAGHSGGQATITSPHDAVNSGFIGSNTTIPEFGTTFSVTFTTQGTYKYICALHDELGMVGTVTVLP
jgi:plastocyanin